MKTLLIRLIGGYQRHISPLLGPHCRYLPTCSEYAILALQRHGLWRGLLLAVWRLLRCNPFGGHGWDPVPPPGDWRAPFRRKRGTRAG